ncbi:MAG: tripartite tricarboxylate transporter TctB family protein [Candidatus Binatia bacterium]
MRGDVVAAIIPAAFGLFVIQQALQLDYVNEYGPGPGFIPFWIGFGFVLLALLLIYTAVRGARAADSKKTSARETAKVLISWTGLMVSVALLDTLGFFVSFALLAIFLVYLIDRRSLVAAATVGIGGAVGFYLVFHMALGLSFPRGPWGF